MSGTLFAIASTEHAGGEHGWEVDHLEPFHFRVGRPVRSRRVAGAHPRVSLLCSEPKPL